MAEPTSKRAKTAVSPTQSWRDNLGRSGGFWADARWYDLHLERSIPLCGPMLKELVFALPPLAPGTKVLDVCAGSGRAAEQICNAYPECSMTLVDMDDRRLQMAAAALDAQNHKHEIITASLSSGMQQLPGGQYDVVVAALALRHIIDPPTHYAQVPPGKGGGGGSAASDEKTPRMGSEDHPHGQFYEPHVQFFRVVLASLEGGGHFLLGDHQGKLSCFGYMQV